MLRTAADRGDRARAELAAYDDSDPSRHKTPAFAAAGLIYSPQPKLDLDLGLRAGLHDAAFRSAWGLGPTWRW